MPDSIYPENLRKNIKRNCWQTRTVVDTLSSLKTLKPHIKENDWKQVHLIVKDNHMEHYINGILMSDVTDLDTINSTEKGYIGVQKHVGPPMQVAFKNIK